MVDLFCLDCDYNQHEMQLFFVRICFISNLNLQKRGETLRKRLSKILNLSFFSKDTIKLTDFAINVDTLS